MSSNLMLHCGSWEAGIEELTAVPVPEPTATYRPVAYADFIGEVKDHLPRFNMNIVNERYALSRSGARMFGVIELANGDAHDDFRLALGLRSSYDHQFANGVCLGHKVYVCDNLAFSGEYGVNRKNTQNAVEGLSEQVYFMFRDALKGKDSMLNTIATMKVTELNTMKAHDLIMQSLRNKALPITKLNEVVKHWDKPLHPEFEPRTAWSLFNAFTEVQKGRPAEAIMEDTGKLLATFRTALAVK